MAKLLKLRRGTTSQHSSFTGAEGEVTVDTDKETLVVHDGSTAGGHPVAAQDMANVPAGTILGTQLENSGVSAGQYGSSSAIPIVTVDAQGLVTAASTTAIDSTQIANGNSNVAVANNGNITITRGGGSPRLTVDAAGVEINGTLDITGNVAFSSELNFMGTENNKFLDINLGANTFSVRGTAGGDSGHVTMMTLNRNGASTLSHAGSTKLATTSTGASVTGNIAASGTIAANGGSIFITGTSPAVFFTDSDDNPDYYLQDQNGTFRLVDNTNSTELLTANATTLVSKVNHDFSAGIDVTGNITTSTGDVQINGGDLDINHTHPRINFNDSDGNPDWAIINNNGNLGFYDATNAGYKFQVATNGQTQALAGLAVTGDITATGDIKAQGGDIRIEGSQPGLHLTDTNNNDDFLIYNNNGILKIYDSTDGVDRFSLHSNGDLTITNNLDVGAGVDVTGNITVTGTVDGRDVASDGSKLDGIESGATADQSASEILTLIKTVDGSGSGLDADTLDGIDQGSFLRSDSGDTANGDITFGGGAGAATIGVNSDISFTNGDWTGNHCKIQHHVSALYIVGGTSGIIFRESGTDRCKVDGGGHFVPASTNTYNLGSSSLRWSNIYTNDLHLSNEGSSNEVDGSWGDWTIQEGESDLFLKNNRSGKKYKFNLMEVS